MKKILVLLFSITILFSLTKPISANNSPHTEENSSDNKDNSKIVIDKVVNYTLFTKGTIIALNDYQSLRDFIDNRKMLLTYVSGFNDNNEYASLTVDYIDINKINLQKTGTYPAYIKLKLVDEDVDNFILADNIKTIKFDIRVSDPNVFDVFITSADSLGFDFSWLPRNSKYSNMYYIESNQELAYKDLQSNRWQIFQENIYYFYRLHQNMLNLDKHYYFYFTNGNETSNIIHVYYDKDIPDYEYMGGDRDGGDAQSTPPSDVEQPSPEISKNQDSPVSSTNHLNTFKPNEHFSESKDELSGQRVLHMQEISKNEIRFSKHGILVTIPSSTVDLLKLKENDIFSIEINKINDYHFKLDITLNSKKINQLKDMKIMVPCTLNKETNTAIITASNNEKITGTYDASSKLVTFTTDYPGIYKIQHKQTNKDKNTFNYLPLIISTIFIICLISFLLIRRGKNYAKKIH